MNDGSPGLPRPPANYAARNISAARDGDPRTTGLQFALSALDALLKASRQGSPREHAVFVDIASRRLAAERERIEFSLRRWAA